MVRRRTTSVGWVLALLGQFVGSFALLALSGPGRIDIDDGQLRFEVAKNLVERGAPTIEDPGLSFTVLPGRDGKRFTMCRLPHSLLGVAAILTADATGPVNEARRHFFFSLLGAVAGAALVTTYAVWFRGLGLTPAAALFWSSAGLLCTPSWYYSTSTFDEIFGTAAIVLAVAVAYLARRRRPLTGAALAGILIGLAFNFKQPLGLYVLPVLGALYDPEVPLRRQVGRAALVLAGVAGGLLVYHAYDWYRFPPETRAAHVAILEKWKPTWISNPLPAVFGLTLSLGGGFVWYCPTLLLSFRGLAAWYRRERVFCTGVIAASLGFFAFICALAPFKGDMSWGPRYLTPVFALLWVFVPTAARLVRRRVVAAVLLAGVCVQVLGLSVDPHRLYLQRNLWSRFYVIQPWLYFHPAVGHLFNRPREIAEILAAPSPPDAQFTPARSATYCLPFLERTPGGPAAIHRYRIFNSLRPWWISQRYLPAAERPVELWPTFWLFAVMLAAGLVLVGTGLWAMRAHDRSLFSAAAVCGWPNAVTAPPRHAAAPTSMLPFAPPESSLRDTRP